MTEFDRLPHEERLRRLGRLASAALSRYELPRGAVPTLVNVSENATYRVEDPASGARWALRVHRENYHRREAIASELAWIDALRRDGAVRTPTPLAGRDGGMIQELSHPDLPRPRQVVLFAWETGEEPSEDQADLRGHFEILGGITARMHRHVRAWEKPAGFERFRWDFETALGSRPHWGSWRDGMGLTPEIETLFARTVERIGERLERFGRSPERFDLVHCDMRLANLLIDGAVTKVIDFDDCGFGYFMYDCATTLSFFEHRPEVPELVAAWVRGYRGERELPEEDEAEIPTFVMLRRLLLVAWIGSHSETGLARSMGVEYTRATTGLCERYLARFP